MDSHSKAAKKIRNKLGTVDQLNRTGNKVGSVRWFL